MYTWLIDLLYALACFGLGHVGLPLLADYEEFCASFARSSEHG